MNTENMTIEEMNRYHTLMVKCMKVAPSRRNEVFSADDIAFMKRTGIIEQPRRSKKMSNEQGAIDAAAWSAILR